MSTFVRAMLPEDADAYFTVRSLTYNDGEPVPEDRREFKWHRPYVAGMDGVVKGIFNVLPLTCTRGAALMKCAGIAGVGVLPHERRSGVGRAMMEWWIRKGREEGIQLSSLYAFSEKYYRQFGYEVCGKRIKVSCESAKFPAVKAQLPIRHLKPSDWPELNACFNTFAHARSGVSERDAGLWNRVLSEHRPLTIYAAGNPVEAYAAVAHNVNFWSTDHISEVAWCTNRGYEAIIDVLRGIAINKKGLTWFEPSDSPFLSRFTDTSVEFGVVRPIMFRVNDVPGALGALKSAQPFEPFAIQIADDLIPENCGPWQVSPDGVKPCSEADLQMDVRVFAQALLGEPSLLDLARIGLIQVNSLEALKAAATLMPALPVYCPEFF